MGKVFGSEQFEVPWEAPREVDFLDIYTYAADGSYSTVTKLCLKNPPPPQKLTPEEEYTAQQDIVESIQHESGATRVIAKEHK